MLLALLVGLGVLLGNGFGISRRGYVTLASVSIITAALQIAHMVLTTDRSMITLFPLVGGALVIFGMLLGAARRAFFPPKAI